MEQHLLEATKNYPIEDSSISSISMVDAEIIVELREALKKIGNEVLVEILSRWKKSSDEDVRDQLLSFNINFGKSQVVSEKESKQQFSDSMIEIGDYTIKTKFLVSLKKEDSCYDALRDGKVTYDIVINEDLSDKLLMCNTHVTFPSRRVRDQVYQELKEKLKKCNIRFI